MRITKYFDPIKHCSLYQLLALLQQLPQDAQCEKIVSHDSYRGYYNELALQISHTELVPISVNFQYVRSLIGETMSCRGEDFLITKDTPIWIAPPGEVTDQALDAVIASENGYEFSVMYIGEDMDTDEIFIRR